MMIEPLLEAERALTMGLLDNAERTYRSILAADPRNSIAVVGLARVALERGDDLESLRLGREALRIDRQNVAALRLVARLEEVLETRGVEVPPDEVEPAATATETAPPQRAGETAPPAAQPEEPPRPQPPPTAPVNAATANTAAHRRRGVLGRLLRRGR